MPELNPLTGAARSPISVSAPEMEVQARALKRVHSHVPQAPVAGAAALLKSNGWRLLGPAAQLALAQLKQQVSDGVVRDFIDGDLSLVTHQYFL